MNPEIKKVVTYSCHAKLFYPTLTDALKAWGQEIENVQDLPS